MRQCPRSSNPAQPLFATAQLPKTPNLPYLLIVCSAARRAPRPASAPRPPVPLWRPAPEPLEPRPSGRAPPAFHRPSRPAPPASGSRPCPHARPSPGLQRALAPPQGPPVLHAAPPLAGLGAPKARRPRAAAPGPAPAPAPHARPRLPPAPATPGGQATPRLLGLPGSSDHPAPAPPRELLRRPQGSLGKLRRRRME